MSLDELSAVLARYPAIVRPCAAPEPLGNAGGGSGARLWRFASGRGSLVARAWPVDGPPEVVLLRIHEWLATAARLGMIPAPIAGLDGRTLQACAGRYWEITPWLEGTPAAQLPLTPARLRAGFGALAAFHQCLAGDTIRARSPGLTVRRAELESWRHSGFAALKMVLQRAPTDRRAVLAARWVDLATATADRLIRPLRRAAGCIVRIQPCLRDVRPDHLLFVDQRLTGLVDFGAMGLECVAADLARLLAEWVGPDAEPRAEALNAYTAIRPLDVDETTLIEVFESTAALLGAGHWARWHFLEERPFVDPGAVEDGLERGLARLARLATEKLA
jgi:homoserine kinase type II